jgi:hypothetical protein
LSKKDVSDLIHREARGENLSMVATGTEENIQCRKHAEGGGGGGRRRRRRRGDDAVFVFLRYEATVYLQNRKQFRDRFKSEAEDVVKGAQLIAQWDLENIPPSFLFG